jgi:hypothetical protein
MTARIPTRIFTADSWHVNLITLRKIEGQSSRRVFLLLLSAFSAVMRKNRFMLREPQHERNGSFANSSI